MRKNSQFDKREILEPNPKGGASASAPKKPEFIQVREQSRRYVFPNGEVVELWGVVGINVSKSGTHRINTKDGKKHIIPPGWLHIEMDIDGDWTF